MTALAVKAPRLNANDDAVKVTKLLVKVGDDVTADAVVAEIEGDKATVEICAEASGTVLRIDASEGQMIETGAILLWLGDAQGAPPPEHTPSPWKSRAASPQMTAKARQLLADYGIEASEIQAPAGRLTAELVEAHAKEHGLKRKDSALPSFGEAKPRVSPLPSDGTLESLEPAERGMIKTVSWHAKAPVPAYLEVPFDHDAWRSFADDFWKSHGLLLDPLLALAAQRLVHCVAENPRLNATLVDEQRFLYARVNLGFAIRSKAGLVMAVVRDAAALSRIHFVRTLHDLQRRAFANKLAIEETAGITLAFSSLASAGATRHVPILPPHTSLIIAHSAKPADGGGVIGASYDHRLLDGDTVARALNNLSKPNGN